MKRQIFSYLTKAVIVVSTALILFSCNGGVFIIYSSGEKIEVVNKLPEDVVINGKHVNLGVMYKQFSIFWVPMWNYGETKYVLVNDGKKTYYDLDADDLKNLKSEFKVKFKDKPTIGFWNKTGGKIIWGFIILVVCFAYWTTRNDNEKAEIPQAESEKPDE